MSKYPLTWVVNPNNIKWTLCGRVCYFNPHTRPTLTILSRSSDRLLALYSKKYTLKGFCAAATKKYPALSITDLKIAHSSFKTHQLIVCTNHIPSKHPQPKSLGVWLHLTNQCNLRCTYCYIAKTNAHFDPDKLDESLNNIFRSAKVNGFRHITLKMSGGECLLRLDQVLKVSQLARKYANINRLSVRPIAMTNGTLITRNTAKLLKKNKIHVAISLDGLSKYHDKNRIFPSGLGSYAATIAGIDNLIKEKVKFNVLITITKQNTPNLVKLTTYLLKRNIAFAYNFFRENEVASTNLDQDDKKLISQLKKCYKLISDSNPETSLLRHYLDRVDLSHPHTQVCGRGRSYLVIGQDGALYPCQMDIGHNPLSPSLTPDPVLQMQSWGEKHPIDKPDSCLECLYRNYCASGCPRLSNSLTTNPYCHLYQELIPVLLRLEAKRLIKKNHASLN